MQYPNEEEEQQLWWWAVVVALLVERSLLTPEVRSSNPVIGKIFDEHSLQTVLNRPKLKKKLWMAHLKNTKCSNYYKALGPFKNQLWWLLLGLSWLLAADENGSKRRWSWVLRLCSILSEQCDASPLTVGRRRGKQHRESSEHRLG